jgi:hypothetical protein
MNEEFEEIEVFGKPVLFTPVRLDPETVPEGLCCYEVRHDDTGWCDPVQIGKTIGANHMGTILTAEEIQLDADGLLDVDPDVFNFDAGDCQTLTEFYDKYTMTKKSA